jgi:hypothetical protein
LLNDSVDTACYESARRGCSRVPLAGPVQTHHLAYVKDDLAGNRFVLKSKAECKLFQCNCGIGWSVNSEPVFYFILLHCTLGRISFCGVEIRTPSSVKHLEEGPAYKKGSHFGTHAKLEQITSYTVQSAFLPPGKIIIL